MNIKHLKQRNMKRITMIIMVLVAFATTNTLSAKPGEGITKKQIEQQHRIRHGVASGQLTPHEARMLEAQQAHIRHDKRMARADGVVTPAERAHIKHEQRRAGANIYVQKNDCRHRH